MKIAIIGAGASGMTCAINIKRNNPSSEVVILEKNNICGKKILLTGNGKCNYWNLDQDISHYHSSNMELLSKIENEVNRENTLLFFDSLGIVPRIKNGYFYPYSNQASAIQTCLIKEINVLGIKIINEEVLSVNYEKNFMIKTNQQIIIADKVVISTGSKAYPKTGSDGFGYELAKSFNHRIIKPLPALVQLKTKETCKEWDGIRTDVKVSSFENNELVRTTEGEILLTDYGVSGICIFQLSGRIARGIDHKYKESIVINFLPMLENNDFIKYMDERNNKLKNRNISELLDTFINYKLSNVLLKKCGIERVLTWECLSKLQKEILSKTFTSYELEVIGTNSFDNSQVCSGGIPLDEININTLESVKQQGLYFTGEILDVDGDCGGYNLGFAFLSGILVGKAIGK